MTYEAVLLAKAAGKTKLSSLEREDLRSMTLESCAMTGIPLVGTDYVFGERFGFGGKAAGHDTVWTVDCPLHYCKQHDSGRRDTMNRITEHPILAGFEKGAPVSFEFDGKTDGRL